jgi:hypothetical protein
MNEETNNYNIILLDAIKRRLEFPELKDLCIEEYKAWEPDAFVVEKSQMELLFTKSLDVWVFL